MQLNTQTAVALSQDREGLIKLLGAKDESGAAKLLGEIFNKIHALKDSDSATASWARTAFFGHRLVAGRGVSLLPAIEKHIEPKDRPELQAIAREFRWMVAN